MYKIHQNTINLSFFDLVQNFEDATNHIHASKSQFPPKNHIISNTLQKSYFCLLYRMHFISFRYDVVLLTSLLTKISHKKELLSHYLNRVKHMESLSLKLSDLYHMLTHLLFTQTLMLMFHHHNKHLRIFLLIYSIYQ